ncbi:MAG: hypothetical protein HYY26_01030 [Acidobacteria bacterium]|nr:hypothetical protein [Acidobacteriota bacterium]
MGNFLAGLLMSLLPPAYRGRWEPDSSVSFRYAAVLSGLFQLLLFLAVVANRYLAHLAWRGKELGGSGAFGVVGWMWYSVEFILHPHYFLLAYLTVEGAVRAGAAFLTSEILPTLPLWLALRLQRWLGAQRREAALGPRVADTVERGDGRAFDLHIASCRPKTDWDRLLTIAYEEQFYEVVKEETGPPPRRFVYLLRKVPEGKIIRGLYHYRPDEPIVEER